MRRLASPAVSVVIPAYDAERYLGAAIASVLAQAVAVGEVIVVDDGSSDATAAVGAAFGPPVVCLSRVHGGIGAARNAGIERATGNMLAFLDADDLWAPGKLERQLAAFAADPGVDLVFGHAVEFRGEPPAAGDPGEHQPGYVAGALLARREAFLRVGMFATGFRVGEFIDWYARAKELGLREVLLPDVVLYRRLHDQNTGLRARDSRVDYTRVLRAALQRRREGTGQ